MPKSLHEKSWYFDTEVNLPVVEKKKSFLWWSWTETWRPTEFKYNTTHDLLAEVNKFIADNEIDEIVEFKNTAGYVTVIDYDTEYQERRGGIKLTWFK